MKIKTQDLIGAALDWAVAKCEGFEVAFTTNEEVMILREGVTDYFDPHRNWGWGGPIVERMLKDGLLVYALPETSRWIASVDKPSRFFHGPTLLIAAMRCYVASKLGDEVDVPDELLS